MIIVLNTGLLQKFFFFPSLKYVNDSLIKISNNLLTAELWYDRAILEK